MSLSAAFIAEMQQEGKTSRRCLERLPESEFDWKPHEKSMSLGRLASHVAELTGWAASIVNHDELDFAKMDYTPPVSNTTDDLLALFDRELASALDALQSASDEHLMQNWTLRNGEDIYFTMPRVAVLRSMCLNHVVHHRGQLSVYMRLKDVPVPALYGPSADERPF